MSSCAEYLFFDSDFKDKEATLEVPMYSEEECQKLEPIQKVTEAMEYVSYILLAFAIVCAKIVGVELFAVLQLAHLSLAEHEIINLYLTPLMKWYSVNGYNLKVEQFLPEGSYMQKVLAGGEQQVVDSKLALMGYGHSFLSNVNLMLLLILGLLFFFAVFRSIARRVSCLYILSTFLLHQIFIAVLFFGTINMAFSVGLHLKYATPENTFGFALSQSAMVATILLYAGALVYLQVGNKRDFGEFKDKMKGGFINQSYIALSIVFRAALGFYMAFGNRDKYQILITMGIYFVFIVYAAINLPFREPYQNYRSMLCHITELSILFITDYYTVLTANQSPTQRINNYSAAVFELCLVALCIVVSAVALVYEILSNLRKNLWDKYKNSKVMD